MLNGTFRETSGGMNTFFRSLLVLSILSCSASAWAGSLKCGHVADKARIVWTDSLSFDVVDDGLMKGHDIVIAETRDGRKHELRRVHLTWTTHHHIATSVIPGMQAELRAASAHGIGLLQVALDGCFQGGQIIRVPPGEFVLNNDSLTAPNNGQEPNGEAEAAFKVASYDEHGSESFAASRPPHAEQNRLD